MNLEEYVKKRQDLVLKKEHCENEGEREVLSILINELDSECLKERTIGQEFLNR